MDVVGKSFSETTTIHGISLLSLSQLKTFKLFWLLVLTGAIVAAVYQTVLAVNEYIDAPISVNVDTIRPGSLIVPDIVVCPTRGLNVSKMLQNQLSFCLMDQLMNDFASTTFWKPLVPASTCNSDNIEFELTNYTNLHNISDFQQFLLHFALDATGFIYQVETPTGLKLDSSLVATNFTPIFGGLDAGICWKYVTNERVYWPSFMKGYSMYLQLPTRSQYDSQYSDGWMIGVVDKIDGYPPNSYLRIVPNSLVDVKVTYTQIDRLTSYGWPKNNGNLCDPVPTHSNSDTCFIAKHLMTVLQFCNCLHMKYPTSVLPGATNQTTCTPFQIEHCFSKHSDAIANQTLVEQQKCLPVCVESSYVLSSSYGPLDVQLFRDNIGIEHNYSVGIVRLSYTRMEFAHYRATESITITTLVGSLGGQLGLWLGASVISVIHFVAWLPQFIAGCLGKWKGKGKLSVKVQTRDANT